MTVHISLDSLKDQLLQAVDLLEKAGVMSHSGHGNMSVRIPGTEHLLLASTSKFAQLTPEQIVVVTFDGEVVEGSLAPVAREIIGMHSGVYRLRGVGAVIHTHSPHVTSFALAHKPLPCAYEALLRFGVTEDIPVAAWAPRGSKESVSNIIEQLQLHPAAPACAAGKSWFAGFRTRSNCGGAGGDCDGGGGRVYAGSACAGRRAIIPRGGARAGAPPHAAIWFSIRKTGLM